MGDAKCKLLKLNFFGLPQIKTHQKLQQNLAIVHPQHVLTLLRAVFLSQELIRNIRAGKSHRIYGTVIEMVDRKPHPED